MVSARAVAEMAAELTEAIVAPVRPPPTARIVSVSHPPRGSPRHPHSVCSATCYPGPLTNGTVAPAAAVVLPRGRRGRPACDGLPRARVHSVLCTHRCARHLHTPLCPTPVSYSSAGGKDSADTAQHRHSLSYTHRCERSLHVPLCPTASTE